MKQKTMKELCMYIITLLFLYMCTSINSMGTEKPLVVSDDKKSITIIQEDSCKKYTLNLLEGDWGNWGNSQPRRIEITHTIINGIEQSSVSLPNSYFVEGSLKNFYFDVNGNAHIVTQLSTETSHFISSYPYNKRNNSACLVNIGNDQEELIPISKFPCALREHLSRHATPLVQLDKSVLLTHWLLTDTNSPFTCLPQELNNNIYGFYKQLIYNDQSQKPFICVYGSSLSPEDKYSYKLFDILNKKVIADFAAIQEHCRKNHPEKCTNTACCDSLPLWILAADSIPLSLHEMWNLGKYGNTWKNYNTATTFLFLSHATQQYWQQQSPNEKVYSVIMPTGENVTIKTDENKIILNDSFCIRTGYFDYRTAYSYFNNNVCIRNVFDSITPEKTIEDFVQEQEVSTISSSGNILDITLANGTKFRVFRYKNCKNQWCHAINLCLLPDVSCEEEMQKRFGCV